MQIAGIGGIAVYALCEPETEEIRYIGYSKNIGYRFVEHLRDRSANYKARWVRKLKSRGLAPLLKILCFVEDGVEAKRTEIAMIDTYKRRGYRLTNSTRGGDGVVDPSVEVRAKISRSLKGHRPTAETLAKLSAARTGKKFPGRVLSAEHRAKIKAAATNRSEEERANLSAKLRQAQKNRLPPTAETREKISAGLRGRFVSEEARTNMSLAHRGKKMSAAAIAKRSATNRNRSEEKRAQFAAKIRAARSGYKHSDETKERMRAAWLLRKEREAGQPARKHSEEARRKIGASNKGKKRSEQVRANLRAAWVVRRSNKCV